MKKVLTALALVILIVISANSASAQETAVAIQPMVVPAFYHNLPVRRNDGNLAPASIRTLITRTGVRLTPQHFSANMRCVNVGIRVINTRTGAVMLNDFRMNMLSGQTYIPPLAPTHIGQTIEIRVSSDSVPAAQTGWINLNVH